MTPNDATQNLDGVMEMDFDHMFWLYELLSSFRLGYQLSAQKKIVRTQDCPHTCVLGVASDDQVRSVYKWRLFLLNGVNHHGVTRNMCMCGEYKVSRSGNRSNSGYSALFIGPQRGHNKDKWGKPCTHSSYYGDKKIQILLVVPECGRNDRSCHFSQFSVPWIVLPSSANSLKVSRCSHLGQFRPTRSVLPSQPLPHLDCGSC